MRKAVKENGNKGDAVVDTALVLFAAHGYHAVGVDRIKEESGVAKMTLYKYFPTKDFLIEKVLERRDTNFRADLSSAVDPKDAPMAQLKAVFDWHSRWFAQPDFNGCMFIKATEEFPDNASNARRVSREHKTWLRGLLAEILIRLPVTDPGRTADLMLVVLDGLIVNANLFRDPSQVHSAWTCVESLLATQLASPKTKRSAKK